MATFQSEGYRSAPHSGVSPALPLGEHPRGAGPPPGLALALGELYRRHADPLARYVFQYVGSRPRAEEIVDETFREVWTRRDEGAIGRDPVSALYTLARQAALARSVPGTTSPAEPVALGDIGAAIVRAIDTLDEREREVLRLRALGAADCDIASALGVAPAEVELLLSRAVASLVRALPRSPRAPHG